MTQRDQPESVDCVQIVFWCYLPCWGGPAHREARGESRAKVERGRLNCLESSSQPGLSKKLPIDPKRQTDAPGE
jgi:hypothetical protein